MKHSILCALLLSLTYCERTVAPYIKSYGGRDEGIYEIYNCNNVFDISYVYGRGVHKDMEKAIERRMAEIAEKHNYLKYEVITNTVNEEKFSFRKGRSDILLYRVRFNGPGTTLPRTASGANAFIYLRDDNDRYLISGDYRYPEFLRENQKITYAATSGFPRDLDLYLNVCRNNQLSVYAILRGSTFTYKDGKLTFEQGGMYSCPRWPDDQVAVGFSDDNCSAKVITKLE